MHIQSISNHLNENSNYSNEIWNIWIQILIIRKGFEAFECNFESFEPKLHHSNANFNHSNGIRSIRMQIRTILKGF